MKGEVAVIHNNCRAVFLAGVEWLMYGLFCCIFFVSLYHEYDRLCGRACCLHCPRSGNVELFAVG